MPGIRWRRCTRVLAAFPAGWLLVFDNAPGPGGGAAVLAAGRAGPGADHQPERGVAARPGGGGAGAGHRGRGGVPGQPHRRPGPSRRPADLAGELGGLPLALEQAAAYIQATGTTLAGYLSVFRDRRADLLARGEAAGHPADVAATLGAGVVPAGRRCPGRGGAGCGCWRAWHPSRCRWPCCSPTRRSLASLPRAWRPRSGRCWVIRWQSGDAVAALRRYSLVTPAGDGLVLVHRLVQHVTLAQLPPEVAGQWRQAAAALVEAAIPADTEPARGVAGVRGAAAARPGCP